MSFNAPIYSKRSKFEDKEIIKNIFYKVISRNPGLRNISFNRFVLEIYPILDILKLHRENPNRKM